MLIKQVRSYLEQNGSAPGWYYNRPSSASVPGYTDRCQRQAVYHGLGYEPRDYPVRTNLVFEDGNMHEEISLRWFERAGVEIALSQYPFTVPMEGVNTDGFHCGYCEADIAADHLHGHIDAVVEHNGYYFVWESKSVSTHLFGEFERGAKLPWDYAAQSVIYTRGLIDELGVDSVGGAILTIKDKNTSSMLEFHVYYDPDTDTVVVDPSDHLTDPTWESRVEGDILPGVLKAVADNFREINAHIRAGTFPKRPYLLGDDWQCSYCPWQDYCWEGYHEAINDTFRPAELPEEIAQQVRDWDTVRQRRLDSEKVEDKHRHDIELWMANHEISTAAVEIDGQPKMLRLTAQHQKRHNVKSLLTALEEANVEPPPKGDVNFTKLSLVKADSNKGKKGSRNKVEQQPREQRESA